MFVFSLAKWTSWNISLMAPLSRRICTEQCSTFGRQLKSHRARPNLRTSNAFIDQLWWCRRMCRPTDDDDIWYMYRMTIIIIAKWGDNRDCERGRPIESKLESSKSSTVRTPATTKSLIPCPFQLENEVRGGEWMLGSAVKNKTILNSTDLARMDGGSGTKEILCVNASWNSTASVRCRWLM